MSRLRDRHQNLFDKVGEGPAIIAFRHRLIHGYDSVDAEIVWDVISRKLVDLEAVAQRLLDQVK